VRLGIRTAALVGGMFIALFAAGCGAPSGGTPKHTVQGCATYGLHAIEHHITVTWKPVPCQGLSKAEVNQAVALAVVRSAGDARKAILRKREGEAAPYLDHLVSALPPGASAAPTGTRSPTATRGRDLPMGIAALIAWLVAAGSGAYVLGSWIARGGSLRRPARGAGTGSPPALLFGHFGLALCGLASWVAYLVTDWAALAWAAVAVLLPVAGLGMATLVTGLPPRRAAPPQGNGGESEVAGDGIAADGADGMQLADARAGTSGSTRTATIGTSTAGTGGTGTVPVRARLAPLVVAAHGALAVTTMILVLLAALGTAAS
jgi:manganese efflux pump family protein